MTVQPLAFDQSVVLDFEEHLRMPRLSKAASSPGRPDASSLISAIGDAAAASAAKDERIAQLERQSADLTDLVGRMRSKLEEMILKQESTRAQARSETQRADRAEARERRLQSRANGLEADLDAAVDDLHRIAEVICKSFARPKP